MKVIRLVFEPRFERGYPRSHVEVFETFVDETPKDEPTIVRLMTSRTFYDIPVTGITAMEASRRLSHSATLLKSPSRGSFFAKRDDE
jgi:hypothetical protein